MIETERLLVRPWCDADREPFWAMGRDPDVMRYLPPVNREGSDAAIARMQGFQRDHGYCLWALERKDEGRFIGFCGLLPPRDPLVETEIGWRLEHAAWGQGFAREAAEASLEWGWHHLPSPTIVAITVIENKNSWGLMERLGMRRDPQGDFDHPALAEDDPLRRHILYRINRPQ